MADAAKPTKRGNSKPNVKKRGSTYTYYIYVTDAHGRRRQHSKGGFKTQREAEEARVAAMTALATGAYVKAERISVGDVPRRRMAPVASPAGARGEHVAFVRSEHPAARDPAHRHDPAAETLPRRSQPAVPTPPRGWSAGPQGAAAVACGVRASGCAPSGRAHLRAGRRDVARSNSTARQAHQERRRRADPPGSSDTGRPRAAGPIGTNGSLHPHDRPRRSQGCAPLEPRGAQRRRRRHSPIGELSPIQASEGLDRRATPSLPRPLADSRYLPAWIFLATAGCRRGECARREVGGRRSRRWAPPSSPDRSPRSTTG